MIIYISVLVILICITLIASRNVFLPETSQIILSAIPKPLSRDEVINSFNIEFGRSIGASIDWNADIPTCTVGTITKKFKVSILQRFNWYRKMLVSKKW